MPKIRTAFSIRPIHSEELEAWLELANQTTSYPRDPAEFVFDQALRDVDEPSLALGAWTAEGALAGLAEASLSDWGERLIDRAHASVAVAPEYRGQGLGRRLIDEVEGFARVANVRWLEGEMLEANWPAAMPLLSRLGYRELERYQTSVQAPSEVDLSELEPLRERLRRQGIDTSAFSVIDSASSRRALYRCAMAIHRDMPHEPHVEWKDPSFEVYERSQFDRPSALRDALFVARDGDEIVGLTYLLRQPGGDAAVGDTGVVRSHRRRGIARALKMMATKYAADHQMPRAHTDNRADNDAMLALNRDLGFKPGRVIVEVEKMLR
jgi:GNAT superfamily N-acetyltransferase